MTGCCCNERIQGLVRAHTGNLAAIARQEGIDASEALDVVQDAFVTLLRRPDAQALCEHTDDAARLLATITRNAARNLRRRHHRSRPHVEVDDVPLCDDRPSPADRIDRAEASAQIAGCLAGLDEVHRHVVTLRVLEELSGGEAARVLGLTPGHVAVLLHRARKQLEICMQGQ
jgi:RNA polymerase sigma-70 factor (ECF subfamily)